MVNKERYIGLGIDQDTAHDKRKPDTYWDAENIRIINNGRNLSIRPLNAPERIIVSADLPGECTDFVVVGNIEINERLYLFLTCSSNSYIIEVDKDGNIFLVSSSEAITQTINYSTSGTYKTAAKFAKITMESYGAGGAGTGTPVASFALGNGGAGGQYAKSELTIIEETIIDITVAGESIAKSDETKVDGDDTVISFNNTIVCRAKGGQGGEGCVAGINSPGIAGAGSLTDGIGNIVVRKGGDGRLGASVAYSGPGGGAGGTTSNGSDPVGPVGGSGGGGLAGDGADGILYDEINTINGAKGNVYGAGGSGGNAGADGGVFGGNGAEGFAKIVIEHLNVSDDLNLSPLYPLEIVANYENDNVIKLYWTDGVTMLKSINVADPSSKVEIVQEIDLSQPEVSIISGGNLKAGNIQYGYSLYNLNGQESVLSPLSSILSITEYMKGFQSNEDTGLSCSISISVDTEFDFIRLYSIHYLELNQTPKIELIAEESITGAVFSFIDDGNSSIGELSEFELHSIGSRPLIVGTLAAKRNRLFVANYKEENFDPDIDVRAFAHEESTSNYRLDDGGGVRSNFTTQLPESTNDCINFDYDTYGFILNSTAPGIEGPNIKIEVYSESFVPGTINNKSLKKGEIYRIGIVLYNKYGQKSPAKYIGDIRIPHVAGDGVFKYTELSDIVSLRSTLKNISSYTAVGVVKYQLVVVERKEEDKTIVSQGFIQPTVRYLEGSSYGTDYLTNYYHPFYTIKDIKTGASIYGRNLFENYEPGVDWVDPSKWSVPTVITTPVMNTSLMIFYSPETIFSTNIASVSKIRVIGTFSTGIGIPGDVSKLVKYADTVITHSATIGGIALYTLNTIIGNSDFPEVILGASNDGIDATIDKYALVHNYKYQSDYNTPGTASGDSNSIIDLEIPSKFINKGEIKVIDANITLHNGVSISRDVFRTYSYEAGTIEQDVSVGYYGKFCNSVALKFTVSNWHQISPAVIGPWDKFTQTFIDAIYGRLPLIELIRSVPNQYGGNTYEVKSRNEYLVSGVISDVSTTPVIHYIGDTYIAPFMINTFDGEDNNLDHSFNLYQYVSLPYIESSYNLYGRSDLLNEWDAGLATTIMNEYFRIDDNHKLLSAYNQKPNFLKVFSKPFNFQDVTEFKNVVQASNEKFPNELIDNWLKFPVNENRYLEGIYGKINKLYNFKGEIFVFQDKAICMLSINPRIQTQATDGVNIELGIGALLYDHKYLTTIAGCTDKFTIVDDGKILFYYDRTTNTINAVEDDKISSLLGVRAILEANSGFTYSVYHRKYDEVLFIFSTYSLVYNTELKKFTHRYVHPDYFQGKHFPFMDKLLYFRTNEDLEGGLHENYVSSESLDSSVTYLMCPNPVYEKVFHNLEYRLQGNDFTSIFVENDLNQSGVLVPDTKNKFDIMRLHIPRMSNSMNRFRGYFIKVKLSNTAYFSLDDMVLMYNIKG
jgi:hypothetical protein